MAKAVVGLSTLDSLAALSIDLDLARYRVPLPKAIYPPLPATYILHLHLYLYPVPVPFPSLNHHRISDHKLFTPLLRFVDGLIFLSWASIIPDIVRVSVQ